VLAAWAQVVNLSLNFRQMPLRWVRVFFLSAFVLVDIIVVTTDKESHSRVSYPSHAFGALAGLLLGGLSEIAPLKLIASAFTYSPPTACVRIPPSQSFGTRCSSGGSASCALAVASRSHSTPPSCSCSRLFSGRVLVMGVCDDFTASCGRGLVIK
jgi:hypothetical protein